MKKIRKEAYLFTPAANELHILLSLDVNKGNCTLPVSTSYEATVYVEASVQVLSRTIYHYPNCISFYASFDDLPAGAIPRENISEEDYDPDPDNLKK